MFRLVRNPDPRKKPPYGSRLDPYHPLSQGLVGCWLMNEGGGSRVFDCGYAMNNGAIQPSPFWKGEYLSFPGDSNSFVKINDGDTPNNFPTDYPYSVAAIINPRYSSGYKGAYIFCWAELSSLVTVPAQLYLTDNGTTGNFYGAFLVRYDSSYSPVIGSSNIAIRNNVLLTGVAESASLRKIYVDGALDGSNTINVSFPATADSASFGSRIRDGSWVYATAPCQIKSVWLWRKALTDSEILQLYEEPYGHILAPQYWYMVDFGAAAGGTTITLIKMSQDWQGQSANLLKRITATATSIDWVGKETKASVTITPSGLAVGWSGKNIAVDKLTTLAKASFSWVGNNIIVRKTITLSKFAIGWGGKSVLLSKIINTAKVGLSWIGKSIILPGSIILDKMSIAWTGKTTKQNISILAHKANLTWAGASTNLSKTIALAKASLSWAGKVTKINKAITATKVSLHWAGKSIAGFGITRYILGLYRRIIGGLIR